MKIKKSILVTFLLPTVCWMWRRHHLHFRLWRWRKWLLVWGQWGSRRGKGWRRRRWRGVGLKRKENIWRRVFQFSFLSPPEIGFLYLWPFSFPASSSSSVPSDPMWVSKKPGWRDILVFLPTALGKTVAATYQECSHDACGNNKCWEGLVCVSDLYLKSLGLTGMKLWRIKQHEACYTS